MKTYLAALARAAALAALWLSGAPAMAQTPATSASAGKLYLWEVTSLTNRVYLYGTVHAGKPAWYPLPAPVEERASRIRRSSWSRPTSPTRRR